MNILRVLGEHIAIINQRGTYRGARNLDSVIHGAMASGVGSGMGGPWCQKFSNLLVKLSDTDTAGVKELERQWENLRFMSCSDKCSLVEAFLEELEYSVQNSGDIVEFRGEVIERK